MRMTRTTTPRILLWQQPQLRFRPTVGATPSDMVNATPTVPATTQKTEKTGATIINAAGEAEAIGWKDILENIRQNVSDSSNKEIYIVAGSDTVVPAEVLQSVMGSNLSLRIEIEEELAWIIEGREITENVGDIDFGILRSADRIPAELITQTTQGHDYIPLSLVHDGSFGMTAKLSVRLGTENIGKYANLFYYNPDNAAMELVAFGQVADSGWVELNYEHASEYLLVMADEPMDVENLSKDASSEAVSAENDNTESQNRNHSKAGKIWIPIVIVIVLTGCAAGYFYLRKKK